MPSDFDRIFAEAQARREAKIQAAEQERLAKERVAEEERQLTRSIAASYLRDLGIQVARRLLDLKVPLHQESGTEEVRSLFGGRKWKTFRSEELWTFSTGRSLLHLTRGGYFIQDYKLPGPQGFDALLESLRLLEPDANGSIVDGKVYVDGRTRRLCVGLYHSHGPEMGGEVEQRELGAWVADEILSDSFRAFQVRRKGGK